MVNSFAVGRDKFVSNICLLIRDIWKLCAWQLSENMHAGKYARAVYATLCGNLDALLPACDSWDDVLWAHTRVSVDRLMEREVRDNSLREYTEMPESYWNNKLVSLSAKTLMQ